MNNLLFLFAMLVLISSCGDDENKNLNEELFEFSSTGTAAFSTDAPTMHYDSAQFSTFIKYDTDSIKLRVNFRGQNTGLYEAENGIFYQFTYPAGQQSIDIVCDTYTGIQVNVTEYGEVGEMIEGTFQANNCDGVLGIPDVEGSFKVIREQ